MKRLIFIGLYEEELNKVIASLEMYLTEGDPLVEHLKKIYEEKMK